MAAQVFSVMPVVMTSATLPRGLAARIGAAAADHDRARRRQPVSLQDQRAVVLRGIASRPARAEAEAAIHDEIEALVLAAGGRTLALFTSRRAMTAAAEALAPRLPWPVLVQGELPKAVLLEALSSQSAACLFATMSFWQGVDVPGPALTLVVIDRIPFPRPDDPLMAARREAAGRAGFQAVDLPRAATLLAQGAGRLIRTATDKGVVAVLDPRLANASYGPALVRALPPMRRTRDRARPRRSCAVSTPRAACRASRPSKPRGHGVGGEPATPGSGAFVGRGLDSPRQWTLPKDTPDDQQTHEPTTPVAR